MAFPSGIAPLRTCCSTSLACACRSSIVSSWTPSGAETPLWQVWQRSATIASARSSVTAGPLAACVVRREHDRQRNGSRGRDAEQQERHPPLVHEVEEVPDDDEDREDREQDEPRVLVSERERPVPGEHREDDGQRQVVVVHGTLLRAQAERGIRLAALELGADELAVRGDDHDEDVRGHDRPEDGADLEIGGARGEELRRRPRRADHEQRGRHRHRGVVGQEATRDVVDEPAHREQPRRERDRLPRLEIGHRRIDEPRLRVRPVEDDEQREARQPRRVRLPLEPVQRLRQDARGDLVLLRVVEAAAVHAPVLTGHAGVAARAVVDGGEAEVEPDEVEGRADPRDPGDHVQQPQADVRDVLQVVSVHRSLAIATSSRTPVSSSSSRVRASRSRSTSRISAFGRRFTKTTKRKPNFSS